MYGIPKMCILAFDSSSESVTFVYFFSVSKKLKITLTMIAPFEPFEKEQPSNFMKD